MVSAVLLGVGSVTVGSPRFSEGQNVLYLGTGKVGTINKIIKGTRSYQYKITIDGRARVIPERFLEPFTDVEESIIDDFASGKLGGHEDYRLFQTWLRLSKPIESNLYSYLGSKTLFNRYQFKPLLRFLSSNSEERLFIADEVGVGKTIEAGIIMKARALHPSGLRVLRCSASPSADWSLVAFLASRSQFRSKTPVYALP